jgi:hypothetical protein
MRFRATVLLVLVTALALIAEAGVAAPLAHALDSDLRVLEQDVEPDFPDQVTFTLRTSGYEAEAVELLYSMADDVYSGSKTVELDTPTSAISLTLPLKLYEYYMPPDTEIAYHWKLYSPTGAFVITPQQTFSMTDGRFAWNSVSDEAGRVQVHWYAGANDFGSEVLAVATRALDRLEATIGLTLDAPARLWVYADEFDWVLAQPYDTPEWAGGRAYPEWSLAMFYIPEGMMRDRNIRRAVPHELSHLAIYQATHSPRNSGSLPPSWLDEGVAMWGQENLDPNTDLRPVRLAATEGRLIPLEEMDRVFAEAEDLGTVDLAYAQSRSVVEFLLTDSRYGREKLARLFEEFRTQPDTESALQAALGVSTIELDRQWREALPYDMPSAASSAGRETGAQPNTAVSAPGLSLALMGLGMLLGFGLFGAILLVRRGRAASNREHME